MTEPVGTLPALIFLSNLVIVAILAVASIIAGATILHITEWVHKKWKEKNL